MDNENEIMKMGYAIRKRVTGREEFLQTMNYVIPWKEWISYVRSFAPEGIESDALLERLLRMYLLQKWFGIPTDQLEDTIYDSHAMWFFLGANSLEEVAPSRTVYVAFQRAMERSDTARTLTEAIDGFLQRYGRKMMPGHLVEASIVGEGVGGAQPTQATLVDPPSQRRRSAHVANVSSYSGAPGGRCAVSAGKAATGDAGYRDDPAVGGTASQAGGNTQTLRGGTAPGALCGYIR